MLIMKVSSMAERTAGIISGAVIFSMTRFDVAPRSSAASKIAGFKSRSRERIGRKANGMQRATCAASKDVKLRGIFTAEKKARVPTAVTISGRMRGAFTSICNTTVRRDCIIPMPMASPAAKSEAITALGTARERENFAALRRSELWSTVEYHFDENPPHTVASSERLNEKTKTVIKGRYRNAIAKIPIDFTLGI